MSSPPQAAPQTDSLPKSLPRLVSLPYGVALGALGSLALAVLMWGVFGRITTTIEAEGIYSNDSVILTVSSDDRLQLRPGMTAHILPQPLEAGQYGYLIGEVRELAQESSAAGDGRYQVRIDLLTEADGAYRWTAARNPDVVLVNGTPCRVLIILQTRRPIEWVLPASLQGEN